jgi:uncharacterized protein (DUF1697 family)
VQTVIASGNVIFESKSTNIEKLESDIESAIAKNLGFNSATFIRSQKELEKFIKKDPFKGASHGKETYLIVTFMKKKPYEVYNVVDISGPQTPEFMKNIEKEHGKEITTRTWKTIKRILKKMQA